MPMKSRNGSLATEALISTVLFVMALSPQFDKEDARKFDGTSLRGPRPARFPEK
jgi:hypothetical protein